MNLKQINFEIFDSWFNYMNESDKNTFQILYSTSIVKINHDNKINAVPRKIVKIRRMHND